jgi:nitroreductase
MRNIYVSIPAFFKGVFMNKKKSFLFSSVLLALLFTASVVCAQSVKLPAPQTTGGVPTLEAIEKRASAVSGQFPTGEISRQELSTLLWAASGRNRGGSGWTVPTAMGMDPYVSIYVASKDGMFLYDGKEHSLTQLFAGDARAKVSAQSFANSAPYILVFVTRGKESGAPFGQALAGAMTQNVYLASQSLNIAARFMATMQQDVVRKELKLADDDVAVCIMPLGKR